MAETSFLTTSFLSSQPRSAARVVEDLEPHDAAALLDRIAAETVAPVIREMIPWAAARCLEVMKRKAAAEITRALPYPDALAIMRLADPTIRDRILNQTTARFARRVRNSLIYPKDTVGAWMDAGVPAFQETMPIKNALRTVKRMKGGHTHVFLTDKTKALTGSVLAADLFRHDEAASLVDIADSDVVPLSSRDSLRACLHRAEWDRFTLLPVVGRRRAFLGGFSRANLRRALLSQEDTTQAQSPGSLVMQVTAAFFDVGVAFANLTLESDEPRSQRPTKEGSGGRKRPNRNR